MTARVIRLVTQGAGPHARSLMARQRALKDLDTHSEQVHQIARRLPLAHHAFALGLADEYRIYCFERNRKRWPDGAFHMLDRAHEPWLGHEIALPLAKLEEIGIVEWATSELHAPPPDDDVLLMASDKFQSRRKRSYDPLFKYALLIQLVAQAFGDIPPAGAS